MCFSMYSDMSSWISASSSPNRNSASALDSSVFPTPEGPRKMNEPAGRRGSFSPDRVRRMARDTAEIASFWVTMRLWSSSSMRSSFSVSSSVSLKTGMPVQMDRTSAISSSSTSDRMSISPDFQLCSRRPRSSCS